MVSNLENDSDLSRKFNFCHYDFFSVNSPTAVTFITISAGIPQTASTSHHLLSLTLSTKRRWVDGSAHILTNLPSASSFRSFQGNTKFCLYFSSPRPPPRPKSIRTHAQFHSPECHDARGEGTANSMACQHNLLS